jgi:hypothetical protein
MPIGQISTRNGAPGAGMKPTGTYALNKSVRSNRLIVKRRIP